MTQYDKQIKQDLSKWVLRENVKGTVDTGVKKNMFEAEKHLGLLTDKEYICMTT